MKNHEIEQILTNALTLQEVYFFGKDNHFFVIAVGELFDGMSRLKKHQSIYIPLMEYIADNRIHSLSIQTYTPKEWEDRRKTNKFELKNNLIHKRN